MTFAQPGYLGLLAVVALMAYTAWRLARWRARARDAFAGPQSAGWRSTFSVASTIFLLEAAALIVLAIARPQWGASELTRERQGVDLVIVLDVSQSMQGTDVQPTRLALAQKQLVRLIEAERGNRIGLVLFAGSSILRSPLTADAGAMTDLINRAGNEAGLLRPGSDLGSALDQALLILATSESAGKAVLVVSDGEDFAGGFVDKAGSLRKGNILVLTAGVGTTRGSQLYDFNRIGTPVLKVDARGQPVVTRLNETNLQAAAEAGGGRYLHLEGETNLLSFREDLARLEQTPLGAETQRIPVQRFQVFVLAAIALLLVSWLVPLRLEAVRDAARRLRPRLHPGMAMVALALLTGACTGGDSLRSLNQEANDAYKRHSYQEALELYQQLIAERPDVPELSYNAGNALHRAQLYERAADETRRALPPTSPRVGAVTYYALGNHYFALKEYELALDAYRSALLLDPTDRDAKYNLELTILILTSETSEQPPQAGQQPGEPGGGGQGQGEQQQPGEPGETGEAGDGEPQDQAQPGPGGQQGPLGTQPPPRSATGTDVSRELQEALRGLNETLTYDEAQRILDLLQEQQQGQPLQSDGSRPPGPDY